MKTLSAAVFFVLALPVAAQLRATKSEESVRIHDGETLVAEYRTDYRFPYVYPLRSPSGANVTRHWPMNEEHETEQRDHPHHRGLWLAHGMVNGVDFWHGKDAFIRHQGFTGEVETKEGGVAFAADLAWVEGEGPDGKVHLAETRRYDFRKSGDHTLILDVTCTLRARDGDVVFGDTKEGSFALRMDRTLRVKGPEAKSGLLNSEGLTDGAVWGKRATWVATHGPDELGEPVVVALLEHPSSFRHPTWWHARDYGLVAANPFGVRDFEGKDAASGNHVLKSGEEMILRYAIVIHRGNLESAAIDSLWKNFSTKP